MTYLKLMTHFHLSDQHKITTDSGGIIVHVNKEIVHGSEPSFVVLKMHRNVCVLF